MTKRARPTAGEIFGLEASSGSAYLQMTHSHPEYGELIRLLPGIHQERPDLETLAQQPEVLIAFFPLTAALSRKIVVAVGEAPIPERLREFPTFLMPGAIDASGNTRNWWIWDGNEERYIGEAPSPEQGSLPILMTVNDTHLLERLGQEGPPEDEGDGRTRLHAFLYFKRKARADAAASALRSDGWRTEVRVQDDEFLVKATRDLDESDIDGQVRRIHSELEEFAAERRGNYDGFEVELPTSA